MATKLDQDAIHLTEKPSEWLEQHFYVPDPRDPVTGERHPPGPIRLAEHQKRIIDAALERDENGHFKYSTIVYSAPKKSGKSAISAAVALYMAYSNPNAYIALIANDGKQADDRLYGPISTCFRLHNQLGGIFKGVRYTQLEATLDNFTKIEPINVDAAGEAGSQPLGTFFCFDEETEILTKEGWKRWNEYSMEDEFITLRPDGNIEYHKPYAVNRYEYSGPMYELNSGSINLCVSPQHKLYGKLHWTRNRDRVRFEKNYVEDVIQFKGRYGVRVEAGTLFEVSGSVPDYVEIPATARKPALQVPIKKYLKFLGWYLAEGCTHKTDTVVIAQSPESKYVSEIKEIISELGFEPHTWKSRSIVFYSTQWAKHLMKFGKAHEKYIPVWIKHLPDEYLNILLETYWKGDGYKNGQATIKYGNTLYATNSETLRDDLSEIAARQGRHVTITTYQDKRWGKPLYTINIKPKTTGERVVSTPTKNFRTIDYTGHIHCPTVPNGIVCIRRGGKVHWQGQSEIWGYTTPKKQKLWTEMTVPPTLYGHAIRWVESYAGYSGESTILEQLYEIGFRNGSPHPDFDDLQGQDGAVVRTNKIAGLFMYWDTVPRMIWQTDQYYQSEAQVLPSAEFSRIHRNQWVSPTSSFIEEMWWNACEDLHLPPLREGDRTPVVVGIDMAVTRDCAALVAVSRSPFDPNSSIAVRGVRIFSPQAVGGIIDQERYVRPVIEDWYRRWNVVCWVYDPKEMAKLAQDLIRAGLGWFRPFGQVNPRAISDKQLHDLVLNKQISWSRDTTEGDVGFRGYPGETLYNHMTQAGALTRGDSYRLEKLSASVHIDAAVALSQAAFIALSLNLGNAENNAENLIRKLQRREITLEEFSDAMKQKRLLQESLK